MEFPDEIPLPLPTPLKSHLEDDCFWILRRNKLLRLPRKPSVETILREYYSHCLDGATEETNLPLLAEVLDSIKIYFDFMLADHLLYAQEKPQYKNTVTPTQPASTTTVTTQTQTESENKPTNDLCNTTSTTLEQSSESDSKMDTKPSNSPPPPPRVPSSVYGAEHLLRLFVKMPLFLSHAQLPNSHVHTLHQYFKDLLGYICSKRQDLFLEDNYEEIIAAGEEGAS